MKWSNVGPLLVGAVGIILVSLTDTIATATNFASRRGNEVDPDQQMVGIGTSNIAAGFFQGFAVSVSGCRAAVVDQSGARTQLLAWSVHPGATQLPGVVVFGWKAPLFLANGGQFRDKVRRLARERPRPGSFCGARWSLTSMSLPPECSRLWKGSSMIAACMWRSAGRRGRLRDLVHRCGLCTMLDREYCCPGFAQVLGAINNAAVDSPVPPGEGMLPA